MSYVRGHRSASRRSAAVAAMMAALALVGCESMPTKSGDSSSTSSEKLSPGALKEIHLQVIAMYPMSKATADGTDLVTAGAVLVLKKDDLLMNVARHPLPAANIYAEGKISPNGFLGSLRSFDSHFSKDGTYRTFVAGEKFWLTRVMTTQSGITFYVLSDPYNDQRYHATLEIPYPPGSTPSADIALNAIAEVVSIDNSQAAASATPAQAPVAAAAPAPAAPPAAAQTVSLGQTKEQVAALLGAPTKVVQLPGKEIDYFPGLKVTFVQGRVADVQ